MDPKFELKVLLRSSPWVLRTAWRHQRWFTPIQKHKGSRRVVEPGDDAVIEGYPRSANTFATDAFMASQGRPVKLGKHFHSPAQFQLARRYGVPAMLLLREPVSAALSWVIFNERELDPEKTLRFYVAFHRPLLKITDSFVVAPFEEVTKNFGSAVERLNDRFGTGFRTFSHDEEAERGLFEAMEARLRKRERERGEDLTLRMNFPHAEKEKKRKQLAEIFEDSKLDSLKREARDQYERLMALL